MKGKYITTQIRIAAFSGRAKSKRVNNILTSKATSGWLFFI